MIDLTSMSKPQSVAVVGASPKPGKIGHTILNNVISSGYGGKIFPINPKEEEIAGLKAYASVSEVPQPVDLAVIAVPAARVLDVARDCGQAGVKSLVVITAGFKEVGAEGLELEKQLVETCRKHGMRMLGPNVVGIIDMHTPLNASFSATSPQKGEIAFLSQSGAMLVAILDWSTQVGLGFSKVVSLGNKADLSEIEFIEDAAADPNTKVILCYIEDIVDGPRFLDVAARAARQKPVIVIKSGTSQAGAQAASSHTGALAGSDLAYDVAFRQCGIIRAHSMTELFDLAVAFAKAPVPKGNRVAIVTNAGGPGIITTDNVEAKGLQMARFDKDTIEELRANLPAEANIYNPVDVLGDAKADRYRFALEKVCADPNVDSVVVLVCPVGVTQPVETSEAILEMCKKFPEKPIFAAFMGGESLAGGASMLAKAGVPCFTFPEPAVASISGLVKYNEILETPRDDGTNGLPSFDCKGVKAIFYDVIKDNRLVLLGSEAAEVANCYGIPAAPVVLATSPEEAAEEADKMGYPVVLKVASPKILHKTDVGGVKIGLKTAEEVRQAFTEIMDNVHGYMPQAVIYGIEVQKMMPKGTELIIGMTRDVQFGPLIGFGLGGIYVNLLKDVTFRLARGLNTREIEQMLRETKAYTLLRGYRGEKPRDIEALVDTIRRVAALVNDFPEIAEMDINPVFAYENGLSALDIKITIS
ncbi:acetate--CoA ligase alpha subunit [Desulfallas thermosapovorans]|uniref:Acetyltransferase n=1 Tax=Desulfallas thermosapovorans DSM 6562 TaxID=1121431 RepID=A0A5S4ZPU8_9FIRM|nr:acetate--CoA ligase [Desulfallas thermosapovorans]TYO94691.1 acetyltransferase [Desulfallas thermosapovorans DSM 6562]